MERRQVKHVTLQKGVVFGAQKIWIQSMLNKPSYDVAGNVAQAKALKEAGCEILRVAIPDHEALSLIGAIKEQVDIPLVADIHFDYRLALESIQAGIDKIRINPGNIGDEVHIKELAEACNQAGIPIRVGVNSGSIEKHILKKYGAPSQRALVESALYHVMLLNRYDFDNIVVSLKASDVTTMIEGYEEIAMRCNYPLHLGVTEAGTERMALIKSSIGIGSLLCKGIGDTIRVSITGDPVKEVYAAKDILKALSLCPNSVTLVSCPTCGRTRIDIISLANRVEQAVSHLKKPIKVAVMGCVVNGPGEAKDADIGIAGGDGCAVLFKKGVVVRKVPEQDLFEVLLKEIEMFGKDEK